MQVPSAVQVVHVDPSDTFIASAVVVTDAFSGFPPPEVKAL